MENLASAFAGVGWCASQHIAAFQHNPHTAGHLAVRARRGAHARESRRSTASRCPSARITTRYDDLLAAPDVDIIVDHDAESSARRAGGRRRRRRASTSCSRSRPASTSAELVRIRDAVRHAGVRTIVSFELRYNPYLKFARWLRDVGWLGEIRFARTQYLSHVTDWYSGWDWVRTRESGRSHLLAAGCHAVDALRWCSGREPVEVSAVPHALHRRLRVADVDPRRT